MTTFQNQIQLFTKCRYFDSILKHEKLSSGDVGALSLKREKRCWGVLGALSLREIAALTMLK